MASWSHFLAAHNINTVDAAADDRTDKIQCFTTTGASNFDNSTSSLSAEIPTIDNFGNPSTTTETASSSSTTLLEALSSPDLIHEMSQPAAAAPEVSTSPDGRGFGASEQQAIPRRNLTEAFEEMYVKPTVDTTEAAIEEEKSDKDCGAKTNNMISPTGVADFPSVTTTNTTTTMVMAITDPVVTPEQPTSSNNSVESSTQAKEEEEEEDVSATILPHFELHPSLKKDLYSALVDRVSFYAVIHDINKEAATMCSNDESGYNRNPDDLRELYDPLVVAVNGYPTIPMPHTFHSMVHTAVIDEEKWLLEAIAGRQTSEEIDRGVSECPPTFLQAMGERDYENPLTSLSNGSRTQLWKPSRSWWEAKSGKNPWIEPKSHNKRWRYLWPLIHYHKFLARCIKKLKRNGVDVKTSVSPVSVFLREEVCSVSDHLAAVSLFDSDQWMSCLREFHGWTDADEESEARMRDLISRLKLRPLNEPGDVDSPLLRSQIDEQYLRAMASARAQMSGAPPTQGSDKKRVPRETPSSVNRVTPNEAKQMTGLDPPSAGLGHPPTYPRHAMSPAFGPNHRGTNNNMPNHAGVRRSRFGGGYPPQSSGAQQQWWSHNWNPNGPYPYGDDTSVQTIMPGGEGFAQHYESAYLAGMPPQYYNPMMYPQPPMPGAWPPQAGFDPNMQDPALFPMETFGAEHGTVPPGWFSNAPPTGGIIPPQPSEMGLVPGTPGPHEMAANGAMATMDSSQNAPAADQTPFKYNPSQVPSPYWGHLDHATLAMMGIATPHAPSAPQTPARSSTGRVDDQDLRQDPSAVNAQPLLLRQQYYGYGYGNAEGYGPPSPATQFLSAMSPQGPNYSQPNFFNYGYSGFSPVRQSNSTQKRIKSPHDGTSGGQPATITPNRGEAGGKSPTPSTVVTSATSESLS